MTRTDESSGSGLKSVERTFTIVRRLRETGGGGVSELASSLDMHKATVHSHLRTLERCGFVINDDGIYRPSLKFLREGALIREDIPVFRKGWPEVRSLAEETGELANLGVMEAGRVNIVYMAEGEQAVHDDEPIGKYTPMHSTGIGKAILAHLDREHVEEILDTQGMPGFTENTITDRESLMAELEEIRSKGYSVDREEGNLGIRCIAAPIKDETEQPIAGVSVTGPTNRMSDDEHANMMSKQVLNAANVIEVKMKYS